MKITGSGSRLSPIAIDDSEDEVLQELVGEIGFESSSLSPMTDQRDKVSRNGVSTNPSKGSHQKPNFEGKSSRKRKRSMNDVQSVPAASTSQQRLDPATYTHPGALSKKAKKRRRKLERLLQEHGGQPPHPPVWLNGTHHLAHEQSDSHIMGGVDVRLDEPYAVSGPCSTFDAADSTARRYNSEIPVASSSSSWVASMAMAAEAPMSTLNGGENEGLDSYPYSLNWSNNSQLPAVNVLRFSEPMPALKPPPAPPPTIMSAPAAPAVPPPIQIIGMKPDHDPSSKHGLFVIPPNVAKGPTDSLSTKGNSYIPNPARTIVIEQLPKSYRTQDWVKNWSKSACGAYPVFSCIDHHGAKALVEFSTAELARKAWGSPRLGAALSGLKTHQLKGRPREDLIKAWWYRVDGIGANAGVGEIEEGEIEGDVVEKEIEAPVKETKKERKARLLRERQARKVAAVATPPLKQMNPSNGDALGAPTLKEVIASQSIALSPNSIQYSQELKSGYPYYSITPQPLPHPLPHPALLPVPHPAPLPVPHPPLSRAPLPPQSALEAQWRPKHELPRKPTRETILNAGVSINSSNKTSPPSQTAQPDPLSFSLPVTPTYEDMDIDDDMDLESPRTAERITFNLSSGSSQNQLDALQSASSATQVVRVSVPNPVTSSAISKTNVPSASLYSVNHTSVPSSDPESDSNQFSPPSLEAFTSQSLSASGTPPLEPRAMKNAPKGPSFKIRSLLARQKELEERISKSKIELGITTTPVSPTASVESPKLTTEPSLRENEEDKQTMEERLRSLVLRSQKNRSRSLASKTPTTDLQVPSRIPTATSHISGETVTSAVSVLHEVPTSASAIPFVKASTFSLDDLAVSFITETIETFKTTPNLPMQTPPVTAPGPLAAVQSQNVKLTAMAQQKLELAAQQKRLEAQIAETKILMTKFQKARTKQEREAILVAMREQSRCVPHLLSIPVACGALGVAILSIRTAE
ncbi:hypothetical protein C0992_000542 [Termitomyces sp. T32_za158]|nr:hypothetical protein C0992_000542 [Termitomyces sp. T32_za158]